MKQDLQDNYKYKFSPNQKIYKENIANYLRFFYLLFLAGLCGIEFFFRNFQLGSEKFFFIAAFFFALHLTLPDFLFKKSFLYTSRWLRWLISISFCTLLICLGKGNHELYLLFLPWGIINAIRTEGSEKKWYRWSLLTMIAGIMIPTFLLSTTFYDILMPFVFGVLILGISLIFYYLWGRVDKIESDLIFFDKIFENLGKHTSIEDTLEYVLNSHIKHLSEKRGKEIRGQIFLYNYTSQVLNQVSSQNMPGNSKKEYQLGEGIIGKVAKEKEKFLYDSKSSEGYLETNPEIKSKICVPMLMESAERPENECIGVISFESTSPKCFDKVDYQILYILTQHIVNAISKLKHLENLNKAIEFNNVLSKDLKVNQVLEKLCQKTTEMVNGDYGLAIFVDQNKKPIQERTYELHWLDLEEINKRIQSRNEKSFENQKYIQKLNSIDEKVTRLAELSKTLQREQPFQKGFVEKQEELLFHLFFHESFSSFISVPLKFDQKLSGILAVGFKKTFAFTKHEVTLMQIIASQAQLALQNANKFEEEERSKSKRLQELTVFNRIEEAITSQNTDEVLQLILDKGIGITGALSGHIRLLNEETQTLDIKTAKGKYGEEIAPKSKDLKEKEDDPVNIAYIKDEIKVISCKKHMATKEKLYTGEVKEKFVHFHKKNKTAVVVPFYTRKFSGYLLVHFTINIFPEDERVKLLAELKHYVVNAIEKDVLYREHKEKLELLTNLRKILMKEDLNSRLNAFVEEAVKRLDAQGAKIYLNLPEQKKLKLAIVKGLTLNQYKNRLEVGNIFSYEEGISGYVVKNKTHLIVEDYSKWKHRIKTIECNLTAAIGVPLSTVDEDKNEEIIGALVVFASNEKKKFTLHDLNTLKQLAEYVAPAIRTVRRLQEEEEHRKHTDKIQDISNEIASVLNIEKVAGKILDELKKMVDYQTASFQLIEGDIRKLITCRGFAEKYQTEELLKNISQDRLISRVRNRRKPLILSHSEQDDDWDNLAHTEKVKSWIGVPLIYKTKMYALITLDHYRPGYYQDDLQEKLEMFSHQAAIAIKNACLYQQSQEQIYSLEKTMQTMQSMQTQHISQTKSIYQMVVTNIIDSLNCEDCSLFFIKKENEVFIGEVIESSSTKIKNCTDKELISKIIKEKKSYIITNSNKKENLQLSNEYKKFGSLLLVPITVATKIIGFICTRHSKAEYFSEADKTKVEEFASIISNELQHAVDLEARQRMALNSLDDTAIKKIRGQKIDEIFSKILLAASETEASQSSLYLMEKGRLVFYPNSLSNHKSLSKGKRTEMKSIAKNVSEKKIPEVFEKIPENFVHLREQFTSLIAVPIKLSDNIIGVLCLLYKNTHTFTPMELSYLTNLTKQAASAIPLITETTREIDKLSKTAEIFKIGNILQKQDNLMKIQHLFLTSLTHSQMFAFKEAIFFNYQPELKSLSGCMINQYSQEDINSLLPRNLGSRKLEKYKFLKEIELPDKNICQKIIESEDKGFKEYALNEFSKEIQNLFKKKSKKILVIFLPVIDKYSFVFCSLTKEKSLDFDTGQLLDDFIGLGIQALEKFHFADKIKSVQEETWKKFTKMAKHRILNILPVTESRMESIVTQCKNSEMEELLKLSISDIEHVMKILESFENFSMFSISKYEVKDISKVLSNIIYQLEKDFTNVKFDFSNREIFKIEMNVEAFGEVFLQLVRNTIEAKAENCEVNIQLTTPSQVEYQKYELMEDKEYVKVIYQDNGPGISAYRKREIFKPFITYKAEGSGLGLPIIQRIIELHKGNIYENGDENGAKFNILIPLNKIGEINNYA